MGKWLERARQLEAEEIHVDSVISANSPPNDPIGPNGTGDVSVFPPADIARGIATLRAVAAPRGIDLRTWRTAVADAARIVADGWLASALDNGWTAIDLFGVEPGGSDDDYRYGLAAWLSGRPLVLLDKDCAIVRVGDLRSVFNRRRDRTGAVLLWELGISK